MPELEQQDLNVDTQKSWQLLAPIPPRAPAHLHRREEQHGATRSPTTGDPRLAVELRSRRKKMKPGMRCLISAVTKGWRSPTGVERRH